ncbi:hypothetical protein LBW59_23850 [Ralstonia solanacearum]|uniref:Uncharacterized protein n=1 Tax=Ralstonia solanacearum TaxID=305 RepID=A0AAW5ZV72_RALSL|nr:hypothetical protein [Ralstonia solanacearum]MDB0573784.1 hypothetical protein [Ralstonia solanacearum]
MSTYRYTIDPRPTELGGGGRLKLFEDDQEVGGRVFPADGDADPHAGMAWFNGLSESDRAHWLAEAHSARPVDAWAAHLREEAYQEARSTAEAWLVGGTGLQR